MLVINKRRAILWVAGLLIIMIPAVSTAAPSEGPEAEGETLGVSYVLYSDALVPPPPPPVEVVSANAAPATPAAPLPAVSTAPMTAGEKFMMFVTKSFKPPGPYANSLFSGTVNELLDNNDGRDSDTGDFFADVGTRAARSMAFRTTANFFEKFAYATLFKQDPRYHRSDKKSVGGKIGYAVSRIFVTQGDRSGDQFNVSYLLGGATAAAISNVWEREERQSVSRSFRRWGTHIGFTALSNILREFLGGQ